MTALNTIYFSPYEYGLDFLTLIGFGLGSFVVISILILYYNRIPKSKLSISELDNPIYQFKDILLQESNFHGNSFPVEKTTSVWVKLLACILIIVVVITPLFELFGIKYFI